VDGEIRRSIGAAILGCCMVLGASGCRPYLQHGVILRGGWSVECNRVPWLKGSPTVHSGCATPGAGCEETCGPSQPGGQTLRESDTRCQRGSLSLRDRCRVRRGGEAWASAVEYYKHPHFFPVPTRPVFSPRLGEAPLEENVQIRGPDSIPASPSEDAPPQIEVTPPAPVPEQIRTPQPELNEEEGDRVTQAPRRLTAVARPRSWIFNPSPDGEAAPAPRTVARPTSQGQLRR
jgi:hypothetical protein